MGSHHVVDALVGTRRPGGRRRRQRFDRPARGPGPAGRDPDQPRPADHRPPGQLALALELGGLELEAMTAHPFLDERRELLLAARLGSELVEVAAEALHLGVAGAFRAAPVDHARSLDRGRIERVLPGRHGMDGVAQQRAHHQFAFFERILQPAEVESLDAAPERGRDRRAELRLYGAHRLDRLRQRDAHPPEQALPGEQGSVQVPSAEPLRNRRTPRRKSTHRRRRWSGR